MQKSRDRLWFTVFEWLSSNNFMLLGVMAGNKWKAVIARRDEKKVILEGKTSDSYEGALDNLNNKVDEFVALDKMIEGEDEQC